MGTVTGTVLAAAIIDSVATSNDLQSHRSISLICGIDLADGDDGPTSWTATMRSPGQPALASMRLLAIRFASPFGEWLPGYEAIEEMVGDSGYLPGYGSTRGVLVVGKVGGEEDPDAQAETMKRAGRELGLLVIWIECEGNARAAVEAAGGVRWHDGPLWVVPTTTEQVNAVEDERAWWACEPRDSFDLRPPRGEPES